MVTVMQGFGAASIDHPMLLLLLHESGGGARLGSVQDALFCMQNILAMKTGHEKLYCVSRICRSPTSQDTSDFMRFRGSPLFLRASSRGFWL